MILETTIQRIIARNNAARKLANERASKLLGASLRNKDEFDRITSEITDELINGSGEDAQQPSPNVLAKEGQPESVGGPAIAGIHG